MDAQRIKFEHSPADSLDSFVSTPGSQYPLFPPSNDMVDMEADAMTPPFDDDSMFDQSMSGSMAGDMEESTSGTPAPEKKPVKKRKSWGQQLPEPKTNLPPRKRAKTEDEKEQRRVERVLRNRRAAQSSRERKRQEVEALEAEKRAIERRNQDLEMRLADSEAKRVLLEQQIAQMTGGRTAFNQSSPASQTEQYRQAPSPITFSQELFSSRDGNSYQQPSTETHRNVQSSIQTVDPASLSPEMHPVAESTSNASSSDMTQHPAAVLCDLQCQSEEQRPWMDSTKANSSISLMTTWLVLISATSTFLQPLSAILNSLRTGSSLSPIPSVLNMIIWLASTPMALTASTLTTSFTTTTTAHTRRPRLSLRMNMLRRLLACSPQLARPLVDATMGAMRSASEQQLLARARLGHGVAVSRPNSETDPSIESLMTLAWATQVIDRQRQRQDEALRDAEQIDTATEVRRACEELDGLFALRSVTKGVAGVHERAPLRPDDERTENQKSGGLHGGRRMAF